MERYFLVVKPERYTLYRFPVRVEKRKDIRYINFFRKVKKKGKGNPFSSPNWGNLVQQIPEIR